MRHIIAALLPDPTGTHASHAVQSQDTTILYYTTTGSAYQRNVCEHNISLCDILYTLHISSKAATTLGYRLPPYLSIITTGTKNEQIPSIYRIVDSMQFVRLALKQTFANKYSLRSLNLLCFASENYSTRC